MRIRSPAKSFCLLLSIAVAACGPGDRGDAPAPDAAEPQAAAGGGDLVIADVGLATPESVLHDDRADIYLVSNINGEPLGKAGNGFISRIRPDGTVEALRWIDGAAAGVTLHAPKGMALRGDTLFVADIDSVRAFHRETGAPLGGRGVPGATFLNDLAVGADGTLYVSDSGLDASFAGTGTDAVHRFDAAGPTAIARGGALSNPNGLAADGEHVIMVPFGAATVHRIPAAGGEAATVATLPAGQLDGVIRLDDGSLLVSSWEAGAVYRVTADGQVTAVAENVEAPADIGWDARRQRLLIPLFMADRIEIRQLR
jgi:sugar lactone lactonase YvrE